VTDTGNEVGSASIVELDKDVRRGKDDIFKTLSVEISSFVEIFQKAQDDLNISIKSERPLLRSPTKTLKML